MNGNRIWALLPMLAGILMTMGCRTTIELTSIPDNAEVTISARPNVASPWLAVDQVTTPGIYQIQNHRQFFPAGNTAKIDLLFQKDGFADLRKQPTIEKRQRNPIPTAELDPLNTSASIRTVPEGATVTFHRSEDDARAKRNPVSLPMENTVRMAVDRFDRPVRTLADLGIRIVRERTTPMSLLCSPTIANRFFSTIQYVRIEMESYVPIIEPFQIEPGLSTSIERNLVLARVNLNIRSIPSGAIVEDWRPAGFGRLGETDLQRVITYEELARRPEFLSQGRLILNLRAFKQGYGEWTRDNIQIPLGDTHELEFHLPPRMITVRIDSEPAGASVYVSRDMQSDDLVDRDETTGQLRDPVTFKHHMGTTPFTYTIDDSNPLRLRHGDRVFFEKEGYNGVDVPFVRGAPVLHGKLDPKRPAER